MFKIEIFRMEFSTVDKIIMNLVKVESFMDKFVNDLFICQCNNTEHQLIFSYFPEEKGDVYVSIHLTPEYRIWKRIWMAIKYIFGYKCKYGHFDEFIFKPTDADKLQLVVDYLKS